MNDQNEELSPEEREAHKIVDQYMKQMDEIDEKLDNLPGGRGAGAGGFQLTYNMGGPMPPSRDEQKAAYYKIKDEAAKATNKKLTDAIKKLPSDKQANLSYTLDEKMNTRINQKQAQWLSKQRLKGKDINASQDFMMKFRAHDSRDKTDKSTFPVPNKTEQTKSEFNETKRDLSRENTLDARITRLSQMDDSRLNRDQPERFGKEMTHEPERG